MLDVNNHMRLPYILHFLKEPEMEKNVTGMIPKWCHFTMSIAQEAIHYRFPNVDILSQRVRILHFFVDMIEINSAFPFQFNFSVDKDRIFLLFMLKGGIEFNTIDGNYITAVKNNHFYLSHNGPGMFKAKVTAGEHVAFVVAINVGWAKSKFKEFSNLRSTTNQMFNFSQQYNIMPHCRMDRQVHQWLREVNSTNQKTNSVVLESILRMYITLALERYNERLTMGDGVIAYEVKRYLDKNYSDQDLAYNTLAVLFHTSEHTLRNQFRAEYHVTIHNYLTRIRLEKARYMIEEEKKSISEVFSKVGYRTENAFRYAYNKSKSRK